MLFIYLYTAFLFCLQAQGRGGVFSHTLAEQSHASEGTQETFFSFQHVWRALQ